MKIGKSFWIFIIGFIVGGAICISFASFIEIALHVIGEPPPPRIAGQQVPAQTYQIDFSKRYNLILESQRDSANYANCLIKGFTNKKHLSPRGYGYFDRWLVVELADGRLVYLPNHRIEVIEEAQK
jgi:hypothetical protein